MKGSILAGAFALVACGGHTEVAAEKQASVATSSAVEATVPPPLPVSSAAPVATASASAPQAPVLWTDFAAGSEVLVFRDLLVGALPYPSHRFTWTLALLDDKATLRFESAHSTSPKNFDHLDASTHERASWKVSGRVEFAGTVEKKPLTIKLKRTSGPDEIDAVATKLPSAFTLTCSLASVPVHLPLSKLQEGRGKIDQPGPGDYPARWVPATRRSVRATVCTPSEEAAKLLLPFTKELSFGPGGLVEKVDTAGIEWAFVNSDMVIQEGGFRFVPRDAL